MAAIQEIFNSREIAIGIWAIVVLAVVLMSKSLRPALMQFVNTTIRILFCRKIVIFSFIFIAFLLFALDLLKWTTFWDISMLKDTILWVIFVEPPLFGKAIEKAKDYRFFYDLVIDNLKFFALFEFFVGFWTFDLWLELIAIPTTALISSLCVLASREKDHKVKTEKAWAVSIVKLPILCSYTRVYLKTRNPYRNCTKARNAVE